MYRLHGFCQSGNTFKVAFTLRQLKQPWEAVHVDFFNGATRQPDWRAGTNEMGEVPVLDDDSGDGPARLTQSGVILTYLADRHGALGGRDADERREVLRWLFFDNHKFTSHFATMRFMKSFMPTPPDPAVMAFLRGRLDASFAIIDKHLAGREFMVGNGPTVADLSLVGYLYFPVEESGYEIAGRYPNITAWLARVRTLDGWADPYDILPGVRTAPKW